MVTDFFFFFKAEKFKEGGVCGLTDFSEEPGEPSWPGAAEGLVAHPLSRAGVLPKKIGLLPAKTRSEKR